MKVYVITSNETSSDYIGTVTKVFCVVDTEDKAKSTCKHMSKTFNCYNYIDYDYEEFEIE